MPNHTVGLKNGVWNLGGWGGGECVFDIRSAEGCVLVFFHRVLPGVKRVEKQTTNGPQVTRLCSRYVHTHIHLLVIRYSSWLVSIYLVAEIELDDCMGTFYTCMLG